MNTLATAREGYANGARQVRDARGIEYEVFARITAALRAAAKSGDFRALAVAVHENRELWSTLAVDLAQPANALPDALRAGLISLAGFAHDQGSRVLAGEARVDSLIDVNTAVMRGLAGDAVAT